jgi:redox-sensitive bicupin YhaK (pirin superfamily)
MTTTTLPAITAKPTLVKRPAAARGRTEIGWLQSRHTFSFGDYFDPDHMGFRSLRVINDDVVAAGMGFGAHPHRDAEIFSYVVEGQLAHKDSLGNGRTIGAGDLQYISAGSGVLHSEFNPSSAAPTHFLQIWLKPNRTGGEPRYAEKTLGAAAKANALTLLFAPEARDGAVAIRQDAEISFGRLDAGQTLGVAVGAERGVWVQVIKGQLRMLGETVAEGDGAAIEHATELDLTAARDTEFLLFLLA